MKKFCSNCTIEYEAERDTSKFCSDNCKLRWNRYAKPITPDTLTFEQRTELLEKLSVKELEARRVWVPNWKRSGMSKTRGEAFLHIFEQASQVPNHRFSFLGYSIDTGI